MRIKSTRIAAFCGAVLCALAMVQSGIAAEERGAAGQDIVGIKEIASLKDPSVRDRLIRNGFVVVPMYSHQIFTPYIMTGLPVFVTTDSVHRTFHILFEEQVKRMEEQLSGDVRGLTAALIETLRRLPQKPLLPPDVERAMPQALAYFCVAAKLFDEAFAPPEEVRALVEAEVKRITAAQRVAASSVFPEYPLGLDYTQFKPRGFYTQSEKLSRFFRAMSWYGNCPFRVCSENETNAAQMIVAAMLQTPETLKTWERIDRIYAELLGPTDDLTPGEYAAIEQNDVAMTFQGQALALRDPKINSMVIPPEMMDRWRELTKGMRLFGKRYVPDGEIFMPLQEPSGLYLMAANGSARAEKLLNAAPPDKDKLADARRTLSELKQAGQRSHYVDFLLLTETLWSPPAEKAPPFMKTEAYADKNLMTALAAWTSMRHTWQLQAKESVLYLGMVEPPPSGYVEPNLPFFDRMLQLTDRTIEIFKRIPSADVPRLIRFRAVAARLRGIAEKELAGKSLTDEDVLLFRLYGSLIAGLSYFEGNSWESDADLPWMSLVADIHTEHLSGKALQVATGGAMPIYVVVPQGGKLYLMEGGVYSYYEFWQPIADRLTDEAWRAKWDIGQLPAMPAWTTSFIPRAGVETVLKQLAAGEPAYDAQYMDDARIKPLLRKELQPGGKFAAGRYRDWALRTYGRTAGREAVPFLIGLVAGKAGTDDNSTALRLLVRLVQAEDVPALRDAALSGDEDHARRFIWILSETASVSGTEQALIEIYRKAARPEDRLFAARSLIWGRSKSSVEVLKGICAAGDSSSQANILGALGDAWNPDAGSSGERPPLSFGSMSADEEKECRRQFKALLLEALRSGDKGDRKNLPREEAITVIGQLHVEEAIPELEKAAGETGLAQRVAGALAMIKSEKASEALSRLALAHYKDPNDCSAIVDALAERKSAAFAPAAAALLDDKRPTIYSPRLCEYVQRALAQFYPDGPGFSEVPAPDEKTADLLVNAWKDYLILTERSRQAPTDPAVASRFAHNLLLHAGATEKLENKPPVRLSVQRIKLAQKYIPGTENAENAGLRAKAADLLRKVAKREIGEIAEAFGQAGGVLAPTDKWLSLSAFVAPDDEARIPFAMDTERRLCDPWGNPYRFLQPSVHSKAACDLYSFGPNGRDENGEGDDIASWK